MTGKANSTSHSHLSKGYHSSGWNGSFKMHVGVNIPLKENNPLIVEYAATLQQTPCLPKESAK